MARRAKSRQDEDFRREARQTFGIRSQVTPVPDGTDPRVAHREQQRLAARHDPSRPSACRLCSITVPPTPDDVDGFKCCADCRALLPHGLPRVWSDILGTDVTVAEWEAMAERGVGNPCAFVSGWPGDDGHAERWGHLSETQVSVARSTLDTVRATARAGPRVNSYHSGCAWCGISKSTAWTETPWRIGRGPQAPRVAACADCEPWVARSGARSEVFDSWRGHLLAAATGMDRAQWGVDFNLKSFFESDPADTGGTVEAWQYLGSLRGELRMRVAAMYPRSVTLTEHERRVLDLQKAVAELEHPPQRTPLAKL